MARIAILLNDRCHPKECQWECQEYCPPVRMGQECIVEGPIGKPIISETLCIGCGICVHKCPFDAIKILNTPEASESEIVHRYGYNGFRLYRLPLPPARGITGLLGPNGTGKSTALRILAGTERPNLGRYDHPPSWPEILDHYRGKAIQAHLKRIAEGRLRSVVKPQYIEPIAEDPHTLGEYVRSGGPGADAILHDLRLDQLADQPLSHLSGGELQLGAIARTIVTPADFYLFDEPSSYLDIVRRLEVARHLRRLGERAGVLVIEHDLALLDYLADQAHLIYGSSAAFGVVSHPLPMRSAVNTYLGGYLKDENVRFRTEPVRFVAHPPKPPTAGTDSFHFPALSRRFPSFEVSVGAGQLSAGETVGVVGPNGTGKTTFVRMLAGVEPPTEGQAPSGITVSYKPQYLKAPREGSLRERAQALGTEIGFDLALWERDLVPGLHLEEVLDLPLSSLSGGELQRSAVALALARRASVYLLDEPSAYLDSDERMSMARLIRRQVERQAVTALLVDHDVYFLDLACDRLMVFLHPNGRTDQGVGSGPWPMRTGMNTLLRDVGITFRRDADTRRPRINQEGSVLDREQRASGEYYYEPAP